MTKHFFEDMVKAKRLVKETNRKEPELKKIPEIREIKKVIEKPREIEISPKKSKSKYMLWFVALVSLIFFIFALSFFFSKAEIVVNPKTQDVVLNKDFSAGKGLNTADLSFDLVVISGEENKNIQVSGEKEVKEVATGTVVIYNAFSSSSQTLDIDTRLEGSNGKIYKTKTKIIISAMGKDGTPGSNEVKIYGSGPGVEYNSAPLDFKIVGFKGTPKYSKIYARSKGDIIGGFVGKAPVISLADKLSAITELKNTLQEKLLQKATGQIPDGFILFKDAVFLNTDNANNEPNTFSTYNKDDSTMVLTLKGTLYGILLNELDLTKKIAQDNIEKYDGSDIFIPNIRDFIFVLSDKDNVLFDSVQNINFNLTGSGKIVWRLDADKFTNDLLGRTKKDFNKILAQYPNIDSAILKFNFPWMQSIPDKVKNIKLIVNYPN